MRIRTIKPSFWRSDDITALPMDLRLLYVGLWSYVDDNGVGIDDYRQIAADLFALEEDQIAIREFVRDGLATLSRRLLVVRYMIEDKSYIFILKWDLHQKVDRPAKPRYPRPPAGFDPSTSSNGQVTDQVATHSRATRETPSTVVCSLEEGKREEPSSSEIAPRSDVDHLCTLLHGKVTANGSKATITAKWRTEARLLLDRDGRLLAEAARLIAWCTADPFWSTNILSMPAFRKQYDKLRLQEKTEASGRHLKAVGDGIHRDPNTGRVVEW